MWTLGQDLSLCAKLTRIRISYMTIYLEKFIYPKLYQTWSDKTNSLTKSDGKGNRRNYVGIAVVEK